MLERPDRYARAIPRRVNPDCAAIRIDQNHLRWDAIEPQYGDPVEFDILSAEARFVLESHRPELSVRDMVPELDPETACDYFARASRQRQEALDDEAAV